MKISKIIPESIKREFRIVKSLVGASIYGFPAKKLKLIGVTGTSGKSTTANLIYHILQANGLQAGVISTVGAIAGSKAVDTGFHVTTPDPIDLQKYLRFMVKRKVQHVVLECSSHALEQGRLGNLKFDLSVFTNIKRDHLDWHKSWENYAAAKAKLADKTIPTGKIILNRDDKDMYNFFADKLKEKDFKKRVITYSMNEILGIDESAIGTKFQLNDQIFNLPIIGLYNVENAMAAINACRTLGLNFSQIAEGMKSFIGVEGRMQVMKTEPFITIVDFAHNADSLQKSLIAARKLADTKGRVITVFGSAGLRDIQKRYDMGEISAEYADITVITAEDPRTEKLFDINNQIIEGTQKKNGMLVARFANTEEYKKYLESIKDPKFDIRKGSVFVFDEESVNSRFDAIEFAMKIAVFGDVVIAEGKGHEQSLCFGETEYPFTDQEAVKRVIGKE
jgi:UDP-N-acetylmuramoyl-L-alanyl-D-glutamate--2,6-diaminopimelate ligase